ncbi:NAD(P)H-dependent oxidoreductase [Granulosicoccaceae sp. 1_MG-2023]|nr:NAD(P)H-dependent oxidoreductase [Granulosicoccaceae sp. 1_MG-2023]
MPSTANTTNVPAPQKVLILFAHPAPHRSQANRPMLRAAAHLPGVTLIDLYAHYPDFAIDIDAEQARLREHDVVIFQFPLYWYSTPSILKEWQDLVLEYGFAYGQDGDALHDKLFLCAVTAGGLASAYKSGEGRNKSLRELLMPLEHMATLCGMQYLPPFALFGSRTAPEEGRIASHVSDWTRLLRALTRHELPISSLQDLPLLNEALHQQEKEH